MTRFFFVATVLPFLFVSLAAKAADEHLPHTVITDSAGKVHVYGANGKEPWYDAESKMATLKEALTEEKAFLGADNVDYHMQSKATVCNSLKAVKLPCDYNTRITLSLFLTVNGKGLFPASGGTNPYITERSVDDTYPDDGFIGQAKQNAMLSEAIVRNAHLFKDGDLSAEALKDWK